MLFDRKLFALIIVVLIAAGLFWFINHRASPILITNVRAVPVSDSLFAIYLNLENQGGPDTITGIQSDSADEISFVASGHRAAIAIPANSKSIMSADSVHFMAQLNEYHLAEGTFIPLRLEFVRAGSVSIKAIIKLPDGNSPNSVLSSTEEGKMDHAAADHSMHHPRAILDSDDREKAPSASLNVTRGDDDRWLVELSTEHFEFFKPETDSFEHQDGKGHGHLYLNGLKLQRMYGPKAVIGALPKGNHIISVTLNTNDHRAYTIGGKPISAAAEINVR